MRLERRGFLQLAAAGLMGAAPVDALRAAGAAKMRGWWMTEPIRWVQANLRETDTALDPGRLVSQLVDFRANRLLLGMGCIVAHDPTKVEHPAYTVSGNARNLGVAARAARYRSAEWVGEKNGAMRLDEAADPDETVNLVDDPKCAADCAELSALARKHAAGGVR